MSTEYHIKYRPTAWEDVVGQRTTVLSLRKVLKEGRSRSFLFVGPSGVGKTTLARLVARAVGARDVVEVDGATHTGIDAMRGLSDSLQYSTIDGSARCVIVDECHAISRQAIQSLLKIVEEPPPGVYWALCTTEADKVPQTIKTRCATYVLKPISDDIVLDYLVGIKEKEALSIPEEGLELITAAAAGSLRQALVYLAECGDFKKTSSVKEVVSRDATGSAEAIDLCRLLLGCAVADRRCSWSDFAKLLRAIDTPAESVRIVVLNYMNTVALGGNERKAMAALQVASCFQQPFTDREGKAPLTLACARVWNGD